MIFSIEYAHYDGSECLEKVIERTNEKISMHIDLYPNAQKTIMFDDVHSNMSYEEFKASLKKLNIQPDCVYGESCFEPLMSLLFSNLEKNGYVHVKEDGKDYIRHNDRTYNQATTFLVRSYSKDREKFSCPSLVATSYLYKLGYFDEEIIGLDGNILNKQANGNILSILPSKYLQVEANARNIIALLSPDDVNRIEYIFC